MKTKTIIVSSIALLLTVAIAISVFFIGKSDKANAESSTTQASTTTTTTVPSEIEKTFFENEGLTLTPQGDFSFVTWGATGDFTILCNISVSESVKDVEDGFKKVIAVLKVDASATVGDWSISADVFDKYTGYIFTDSSTIDEDDPNFNKFTEIPNDITDETYKIKLDVGAVYDGPTATVTFTVTVPKDYDGTVFMIGANGEPSDEEEHDGELHKINEDPTYKDASYFFAYDADSETEVTSETTATVTTTKKDTSTNTATTATKSNTTTSKCTHPAAQTDPNRLYIKRYDQEAGIENRRIIFRGCEDEQWVVWQCEVCGAYPIVYEVLEAPGHDFGEEEVIRYPNLNEDGYYGCRCQTIGCDEIKTTTAIPARSGSYSTIDSRFEIGVYADGSEHYHLYYPESETLTVLVRDERTYGKVPTITFDETTYCLTVIYETKNGGQEKFYNYIDKEIINKNYHYDVTLDDSGIGNIVYNSNFLV